MPHIPQSLRDDITNYKSLKYQALGKIAEVADKKSNLFGFESPLELHNEIQTADLSSKILLCFNGELTSPYNTRIDLILMGKITDFEKELKLLTLIHNRFKKSSVAWHYRNILFRCGFSQALERVLSKLQQVVKEKPQPGTNQPVIWKQEDFGAISAFWNQEIDRLDPVINKHGRSYKIWEYLVHISCFIHEQLTSGLFSSTAKDIMTTGTETLRQSFATELEILLIQHFTKRFEETKQLARKNVHNHCIFVLMAHYLKALFALEVGKFLDNEAFYEELVAGHLQWLDEVKQYYSMLYSVEAANAPVTTLSLLEKDRRKLESLHLHREEVEYMLVCHRAKTPKRPR